VRKALEMAGCAPKEIHLDRPFPMRHLEMLQKTWVPTRDAKAVWVTEGGHRLVPLLSLLTRSRGIPLIFDPFLSRYNTRIEDRKLHGRRSLEALVCLWQDWSSVRRADHLVFDTHRHMELFRERYGFRAPATVLPVGVDQEVFRPLPPPEERDVLTVLFWGTFIPLQGIPVILQAAALLKDHREVRIQLVGNGQTYGECRRLAKELALENVEFHAPVSPLGLAELARRAHVLLGIFDDGLKASNVVPNKVVQACALARPCVTRASVAISEHLRDGQEIVTVPAAAPSALADAILLLRDPSRRAALAASSRLAFEREFSLAALARIVAGVVQEAVRNYKRA
jgi:glycosyltransferase involved in cell wall biosynthesis